MPEVRFRWYLGTNYRIRNPPKFQLALQSLQTPTFSLIKFPSNFWARSEAPAKLCSTVRSSLWRSWSCCCAHLMITYFSYYGKCRFHLGTRIAETLQSSQGRATRGVWQTQRRGQPFPVSSSTAGVFPRRLLLVKNYCIWALRVSISFIAWLYN